MYTPPATRPRRPLALAMALSMGVMLAVVIVTLAWGARRSDFQAYYAAAKLIASHQNPYDREALWAAERQLYRAEADAAPPPFNPYLYAPLFAWLLVPLTSLEVGVAHALFAVGLWLATVAAGALLLRALGWGRHRGLALGALAFSPPLAVNLMAGQVSPLLLLAFVAALALLRGHRPGWAGMALALGWLKPHLMLPLGVFMALWGARHERAARAFLGFWGATLVGLLLTWLGTGPESLLYWAGVVLSKAAHLERGAAVYSSLGAFYTGLPQPYNTALAVGAVALACLYTLFLLRQQAEPEDALFWRQMALFLTVWLVAFPYVIPQDNLLLALPLLVLVRDDLKGLGRLSVIASLLANGTLLFPFLMVAFGPPLTGVRVLPAATVLLALEPWRELLNKRGSLAPLANSHRA